jgi:hypothetical protein
MQIVQWSASNRRERKKNRSNYVVTVKKNDQSRTDKERAPPTIILSD